MPANEFEKQVQKQLDDFQLNPSASVWKKVEEEIRKKKRRRVIIFFALPVVLAFMSYSVYYFLHTGKKTEGVQQPVIAKNEKSLVNDKINASIETKEQRIASPLQDADKQDVLTEKKIAQKKNITGAGNIELQISSNNPITSRIKNKPLIKYSDEVTTVQKKQYFSPVINNNVSEKQELSVTIDKPGTGVIAKNKITEDPVQQTDEEKDKVVVTAKDVMTEKTDSTKTGEVIKTDNKEIIAKKKTGKPNIKWGIDFSAGIAGVTNGAFSLGGQKSVMDALYNPTSTPGGNPAQRIPPSSVNPGLLFKMGVVGELQVSRKSRLSAGLQYVYAGNRIKTGAKRDTALRVANNFAATQVNQVYGGTHQKDYTNSYHFIQLPVWYHWQINKGKKLPIQWNIGLSFSYLFATNGLVYDTAYNGIYYRNKSAFNKIHFNLGTGLSFRLKSKNGMEWVVGPELSFDTRKLVNNGYDKKQYLLSGGINAKLFLPKKK